MKYVQYKKWRQSASMIVGYVCTESTFDIVNGQKVLKTESDDYYDNDKHRWIEICDEDAAINSQSYLEFLMRNEACLAEDGKLSEQKGWIDKKIIEKIVG